MRTSPRNAWTPRTLRGFVPINPRGFHAFFPTHAKTPCSKPMFFQKPCAFLPKKLPYFIQNFRVFKNSPFGKKPRVFSKTLCFSSKNFHILFKTTVFLKIPKPVFFRKPRAFLPKNSLFYSRLPCFSKIPFQNPVLFQKPELFKKDRAFYYIFKILQGYKKGSTDRFFNSKHGNKHVR